MTTIYLLDLGILAFVLYPGIGTRELPGQRRPGLAGRHHHHAWS